jgi:hypothetical protein
MTHPELLYDEIFSLLYAPDERDNEAHRQFLVGAHGRRDLSVPDHLRFVRLWREITQDLFDHRQTATKYIHDDSPLVHSDGFVFCVSGHETNLYQAFYIQHALWFAEAVMTQHVRAHVALCEAVLAQGEQILYIKVGFIASRADLIAFLLPVKHAISAIYYMHQDIMESPMRCKQFLEVCMPGECAISAAYYWLLRVVAAFGSACGSVLQEGEPGDRRSRRKTAWLNFLFCRTQIEEKHLKAVCAAYGELLTAVEATVDMQEFVLRGEEAEQDGNFRLALACYRTACRSHGWVPHQRAMEIEKDLFPKLRPDSGDSETPISIDPQQLLQSPPHVDVRELKELHKLGVRPEANKRQLQLSTGTGRMESAAL